MAGKNRRVNILTITQSLHKFKLVQWIFEVFLKSAWFSQFVLLCVTISKIVIFHFGAMGSFVLGIGGTYMFITQLLG